MAFGQTRVAVARQDLPLGNKGADRMVAIEGIGWRPATRVTGTPRQAAPGFSVPADSPDASQAQETAAPEAASLASVLTLQELGSEAAEDRAARRHGQSMLAELAALQRALLSDGQDDAATLDRLAELAAAVPRAADRQLAAMVSAIVVRVRVELARRR